VRAHRWVVGCAGPPDFVPVHDRGRVLADAAVLIADGGRVLSDLSTLRDQAELFGPVASDPTLWRALHEIGQPQRRRIVRARAKTREHVWSLIEKRHGQLPPSRVADRDLNKTGPPAVSVGEWSWSPGEGWAESASGEGGDGDECFGAVVAVGAAGQ
jgi:hypothetical protein